MKDIFREIWEIRGMISRSIESGNISLFDKARDRFLLVYEKEMYLDTLACATAGREYENQEEFDFDRESNFSKLAFDLEYSRNEVLRKEFSGARSVQFLSPIEVLYFTRLMFDELVLSIKNGEIEKENADEDFKAINDNIDEIIRLYQEVHEKSLIQEKVTLRLIQKEVNDKYNELMNINENTNN